MIITKNRLLFVFSSAILIVQVRAASFLEQYGKPVIAVGAGVATAAVAGNLCFKASHSQNAFSDAASGGFLLAKAAVGLTASLGIRNVNGACSLVALGALAGYKQAKNSYDKALPGFYKAKGEEVQKELLALQIILNDLKEYLEKPTFLIGWEEYKRNFEKFIDRIESSRVVAIEVFTRMLQGEAPLIDPIITVMRQITELRKDRDRSMRSIEHCLDKLCDEELGNREQYRALFTKFSEQLEKISFVMLEVQRFFYSDTLLLKDAPFPTRSEVSFEQLLHRIHNAQKIMISNEDCCICKTSLTPLDAVQNEDQSLVLNYLTIKSGIVFDPCAFCSHKTMVHQECYEYALTENRKLLLTCHNCKSGTPLTLSPNMPTLGTFLIDASVLPLLPYLPFYGSSVAIHSALAALSTQVPIVDTLTGCRQKLYDDVFLVADLTSYTSPCALGVIGALTGDIGRRYLEDQQRPYLARLAKVAGIVTASACFTEATKRGLQTFLSLPANSFDHSSWRFALPVAVGCTAGYALTKACEARDYNAPHWSALEINKVITPTLNFFKEKAYGPKPVLGLQQ